MNARSVKLWNSISSPLASFLIHGDVVVCLLLLLLLLLGDEKRKLFWGSIICFVISKLVLVINFDWSTTSEILEISARSETVNETAVGSTRFLPHECAHKGLLVVMVEVCGIQ
jgi:hypothetical protein